MRLFLCIAICIFCLPLAAWASEIRYQPVNPAFGGFPGNGDYLMRTAEAQQDRTDGLSDPREDFGAQVSRFLLSNIASNISDQILGEDAADSGVFIIEDHTIEFNRVGGIVNVTITSPTGTTSLQIPAPTF